MDRSDRRLFAKVRGKPRDVHALDVLVERHWKQLFARCRLLTVNPDEALHLAETVWRRFIRTRQTIKPKGNFRAHLFKAAISLWREQTQFQFPTGTIKAQRQFVSHMTESTLPWNSSLSELQNLPERDQILLEGRIDAALKRLTPTDRDALLRCSFDDTSDPENDRH